MSDFLCIRLRDAELTPLSVLSWVLLEPNSTILERGSCLLKDLPDDVPPQSGSRRVIVLAPTEHLFLTSVPVAEGQRRHLKQVLPFMVEEKVIDPIETMHIATPGVWQGSRIDVACMRRDTLSQWLDCLAAVEIMPDYLFADAQCVTAEKGDWQLLFDGNRVLIGDGDRSADEIGGVKLAPTAMAAADSTVLPIVKLLLARSRDGLDSEDDNDQTFGSADDDVFDSADEVILQRPASVALLQGSVESLDELYATQQSLLQQDHAAGADRSDDGENVPTVRPDGAPDAGSADAADLESGDAERDNNIAQLPHAERKPLAEYLRSENIDAPLIDYRETSTELLAITAVRDHEKPINFLQGDFRPSNANAATQHFMRRVAMASAACLAVFLLCTLGGGFYLDNRADSYQKKNVAAYRALFPGERVRDPVRQMKSKLKSGNAGATNSDFLPLLDVASRSMASLGESADGSGATGLTTTIKQLRYDAQRGNVTMELQASTIDQLESYKDLLTGEGLAVDILSANQDGDIVNGRLQIGRS